MSFADWVQTQPGLRLNGHTDVLIAFSETDGGMPFRGEVGGASGHFVDLASAMDWCEETAKGRAYLNGAVLLPLEPEFDEVEVETNDRKFLDERGLR
jgi:hypothetical protein